MRIEIQFSLVLVPRASLPLPRVRVDGVGARERVLVVPARGLQAVKIVLGL